MDRKEILDRVEALNEAEFERLRFRLGVSKRVLPGDVAALTKRAVALVEWIEDQPHRELGEIAEEFISKLAASTRALDHVSSKESDKLPSAPPPTPAPQTVQQKWSLVLSAEFNPSARRRVEAVLKCLSQSLETTHVNIEKVGFAYIAVSSSTAIYKKAKRLFEEGSLWTIDGLPVAGLFPDWTERVGLAESVGFGDGDGDGHGVGLVDGKGTSRQIIRFNPHTRRALVSVVSNVEIDKDRPSSALAPEDDQMTAPASTFQQLLDFEENRLVFEAHLLPALLKGDVIPFVGAGMSMPCGFPSWTGFLKKEALRRGPGVQDRVNALLDLFQYEDAAQSLVDAVGSDTAMNGRLQTYFGKTPRNIDVSNAPVRHLPSIFRGPLVTTNYDNVLERVYHNRLQVEAGASVASFRVAKNSSDPIYLFKLHGRADIAQGRILTKKDYDEHYGLKVGHPRGFDSDKRIPSGLRTLFSANSILFLGCSLAQDRTMLLLEDMMRREELPHLFALVAEEGDVVAQRKRLDGWGIKVVYYPKGEHEWVETFLAGVAQVLGGAPENPH